MGGNQTIGKYGGHNGDYCSRVDSANQYSYGFGKFVSEISSNPIKKVKESAWVKLTDLNKKIKFVVAINDKNNKNIFWAGHEINPIAKEVNKWYKIEIEDTFPEFESNGAHFETYIWNPDNNVAYIDDIEIQFFEE